MDVIVGTVIKSHVPGPYIGKSDGISQPNLTLFALAFQIVPV